MAEPIDNEFVDLLNKNLGIAHKVSRIYFDDVATRKDVVQEMMYQLWRSFPSFDGRSKFSTWMYKVCLNTALTFFRKSKRFQRVSLDTKHLNIPDTADTMDEDMQRLHRAIARLSPLNKAIILLYLDDLTYEEIAAVTGLTKSNVSVRLVRIRKELESDIKGQTN
jgi:RNA polymerase sigma factor (sigma-70 family)